jgi:hypothetical protein
MSGTAPRRKSARVPTISEMSARPTSAREPLVLLEVVRDVAEASGSPDPQALSQRAWDAARDGVSADAPPARRIAALLRLPWAKVLALAFMDEPGRSIALGHALGEEEQDWLMPEYAGFVPPREYMRERKALLASDDAHWLHGRRLILPNVEQLRLAAGSWDAALTSAGLDDSHSPEYGRRRRPPSIIDILDRCYEAHGTEPTSSESEVFARANGIPYPRRERGRAWSSYVGEWKEGRLGSALAIPDRPPPTALRPDYALDVGAGHADERRAPSREDFDEAVSWAMRYLGQLNPGERATERGYNTWASGQEGAFYTGAFQLHHGGWSKVRDVAWARLRAESRGARPPVSTSATKSSSSRRRLRPPPSKPVLKR